MVRLTTLYFLVLRGLHTEERQYKENEFVYAEVNGNRIYGHLISSRHKTMLGEIRDDKIVLIEDLFPLFINIGSNRTSIHYQILSEFLVRYRSLLDNVPDSVIIELFNRYASKLEPMRTVNESGEMHDPSDYPQSPVGEIIRSITVYESITEKPPTIEEQYVAIKRSSIFHGLK